MFRRSGCELLWALSINKIYRMIRIFNFAIKVWKLTINFGRLERIRDGFRSEMRAVTLGVVLMKFLYF